MNHPASATTWQNFKRLMRYTKPYKYGLIISVIGMFGYAAIDSFFSFAVTAAY